ncbi:MAG: D-alanyl-D-alanine carboxypeptidase [Alphaproteobacteria bacterium]|nr:D-alanyl-D-alanine carboxypeptidase [Alphaproteobacteria bacterium]
MARHAVSGALAVVLVLAATAASPPPAAAADKAKTLNADRTKKPAEGKAPGAPATDVGAPTSGPNIDTQARHVFIIETETGTVLLDKLAEERMPPASMSKIMTAYVVFDLMKQGRIKLDDELPVSEKAWRLGGSKMFVPVGGRIKVDDLIRGMIVQSGNDSCLVLAEGLAGSEEAFVELMNQKAKQIGLQDSHFDNVTGLPDPNHWMTARDLATLAWRTMQDFPEYYHYYSEMGFAYNSINQGNRNPLLYKNMGADGLKTGHTDESGYSLTASVIRDKRRIIMVAAGLPSMKARAQESERLVEWAFREFNDYRLFGAGDKVDDADIWLGAEAKVPMTLERDLVVTLPRKSRKDMKVTVAYDRPVPAPVAKGDKIGKVIVTVPEVAATEVPLVAAASVGRIGTVGHMASVVAYLIWGNRR